MATNQTELNGVSYALPTDPVAVVCIDGSDPEYFTEPVVFNHRWRKLADREVIQAPCTMESALLYLKGGRGK